jgi:hypothetical protein
MARSLKQRRIKRRLSKMKKNKRITRRFRRRQRGGEFVDGQEEVLISTLTKLNFEKNEINDLINSLREIPFESKEAINTNVFQSFLIEPLTDLINLNKGNEDKKRDALGIIHGIHFLNRDVENRATYFGN